MRFNYSELPPPHENPHSTKIELTNPGPAETITIVPGNTNALEHKPIPYELPPSEAGDATSEPTDANETVTEIKEVPEPAAIFRPAAEYSHFKVTEQNPWTPAHFNTLLKQMGAENPGLTNADTDRIKACYAQEPQNRSYHNEAHGLTVGQSHVPDVLRAHLTDRLPVEEAASIRGFGGLLHDVGYKHVDELDNTGRRAWPTALREIIGEDATYTRTEENGKAIFHTHLTEAGKNDPTTRMVADMFGVGDDGIIHNQGGNEFDSALAAAKIAAQAGAKPRAIIGAVATIAATIPFRQALRTEENGTLTAGHMEDLAHKVHAALLNTGATTNEHAWEDTNNLMFLCVEVANNDIAPFTKPDNFAEVVHGGRGVKAEEVPELRDNVTNIRQLTRAAGLQRSAPLLYGWLGGDDAPVLPENVPHVYIPHNTDGTVQAPETSYPPLPSYFEAAENTRKNADMASKYFIAHELGIALVGSIATHIGEPEATVPGFVHASTWNAAAVAVPQEKLSHDDDLIYNELLTGAHQQEIDSATPQRSPIGGIIYGALGTSGVLKLSERVQQIRTDARKQGNEDPFTNPAIAAQYIDDVRSAIGDHNFRVITTELRRVAIKFQDHPTLGNPNRIGALATLGGGVIKY